MSVACRVFGQVLLSFRFREGSMISHPDDWAENVDGKSLRHQQATAVVERQKSIVIVGHRQMQRF
jgi:hypothetical protein